MLRIPLSVRGKILLSIGLLTLLLVVTLFVFVTSLQGAADQARVIDAAGEIRTASVNIDLLSREITTTSTNNQNMILAIESVINDDVKFTDSITRFFNGSQLVMRDEFAAFMPFLNEEFRSNRTEFPEILAAVYAPLVIQNNRSDFESSVVDEGFVGFHILEWGNIKQLMPAQQRDRYFPVNFIVPFDVNRTTSFGVDLGSNTQVLAALDQAGESGEPLILSNTPFKLSHSERDYTFWIIAPVYHESVPITLAERKAKLQGYLILSVDTESLVEAATARLVQSSVVLQIADWNAPDNSKPIFANSRLNLASASGLITASFPLELFGKDWSVTLAQGIDVEASLKKLSETASALNQEVDLLQVGAASLPDSKAVVASEITLSTAFTKMADRNKTLQKNIKTFVNASTNSDREGLLPALQDNALAVFQSSTAYVDELEQALEHRVEQAIQVSGLVAVLALIIITAEFLLVRQILQNLSRLNRAALSLAAGHLEERVNVGTQDEIGHIATSMNLMASQLQEFINTLEQRVVDRTQDLEIARKHAEQASKAKSTFLSNMSHELRTPLNVIIGYANSMLKMPKMFGGAALAPVHQPYMGLIAENGQYLVGLINDILDLSKIEASKLDLHCSSVNLVSVMRNVVAISIGLLKDKPIQIRQDLEDDLPRVWADPMRLRQICLNLTSNAIKFTSTGSITLWAHTEGSFVRVSVIDTGIGIPDDALGTIFDRFEQAGQGSLKQYGGTGLGLDISKQLCIMHGGEMSVQSTLGQGSTFSFTIPISTMSEAESLLASDKLEDDDDIEMFIRKTNSPKTDDASIILLVEDDTAMRELLRLALESAGHVVVDAHDSEKAIEIAVGLLPTVIILDIHLPTARGWQILAKLKDFPDTAAIPVIVCEFDDGPEGVQPSGNGVIFLRTPTTPEAIMDAVYQVFSY